METRSNGFIRSQISRILHYRLVQRSPMVITAPTIGAETTDALTVLISHGNHGKHRNCYFNTAFFCEFREFCVP